MDYEVIGIGARFRRAARCFSLRHLRSANRFILVLAACGMSAFSREADGLRIAPPTKLTVVVVVDQLSNEVLMREQAGLTGGLRQLLDDGTVYLNARYVAAPMETANGHAALSTGCYGDVSGIVANYWFDRRLMQDRYCVEDAKYHVLGRASRTLDGTSPANLRAEALADVFGEKFPHSKRIAVAGKDRSAILLGGHMPTFAVWFDKEEARYTTSDFYAQSLPAWAKTVNAELSGESRAHGWEEIPAWHPTGAGEAVEDNPGLDCSTLELAAAAVHAERLGRQGHDLLLISLSGNDVIIHLHGPASQEAKASLSSIDRCLGVFLEDLDHEVGLRNVTLALTADHGGGPSPIPTESGGLAGGYVDLAKMEKDVNQALFAKFGIADAVLSLIDAGLYLKGDSNQDFELMKAVAATTVAKQPGILQVLVRGREADWGWSNAGRALARGYDPENGADIIFVPLPQWIPRIGNHVAGHGSPYAYDRHVPLIVRTPWSKPSVVLRPVDPIDLPGTLGILAGARSPRNADGELLEELFPLKPGTAR